MDQLFLNTVGFPISRGTLSRFRDELKVWCWEIEIYCEESPQLDYRDWSDERERQEMDWLAGTEPYLYAQMLPLPAESPDELIGRTFSFPQSPDDDPAEWDRGVGWQFFGLYTWEHDLIYPTTVTFIERREKRYRVKIEGSYPANNTQYALQVETWLDWLPN